MPTSPKRKRGGIPKGSAIRESAGSTDPALAKRRATRCGRRRSRRTSAIVSGRSRGPATASEWGNRRSTTWRRHWGSLVGQDAARATALRGQASGTRSPNAIALQSNKTPGRIRTSRPARRAAGPGPSWLLRGQVVSDAATGERARSVAIYLTPRARHKNDCRIGRADSRAAIRQIGGG